MDASKPQLWVNPGEWVLCAFQVLGLIPVNGFFCAFQVLATTANLARICFNYTHTFSYWHFLRDWGLGGHFSVTFFEPFSGSSDKCLFHYLNV